MRLNRRVMKTARQQARFDWLMELGGALALGLAAAFAAFKAAPSLGLKPYVAMAGSGLGALLAGALVMRLVRPEPRIHPLAAFAVIPIGGDILELTEVADEPLLLDTPFEEPVVDLALLLEDALPETDPGSRVVQLFASPAIPTPGQLKERIDRHLATGTMHMVREFEGPASDASDALFAALNELKRSLR